MKNSSDMVPFTVLTGLCLLVGVAGENTQTTGSPEPPYIFTTIELAPYLTTKEGEYEGNLAFEGFIPDLLEALCGKGALPCNYELQLVKDNAYGSYDASTGRWIGMIGEVMVQGVRATSAADMAAAPISITDARKSVVDFSTVWLNVSLALVTHKDNGLRNLTDVTSNQNFSVGAIEGGTSLKMVRSATGPYSGLWSAIESNSGSNVQSTSEGIERAKLGNYTFILDSAMAEYQVHLNCDLHIIGRFLPMEGLAFALTKGSDLRADLDRGIDVMVADGELDELRQKWFRVPCVSAAGPLAIRSVWLVAVLFVVYL